MKKNFLKQASVMCLVALMALMNAGKLMARGKQVENKYLVGVWLMKSMQWDGEEKTNCGDTYTQVKVYGADGEYSCAEIVKKKDGTVCILPHEYGTYTYSKDGVYTEMGRKTDKDAIVVVDKNNFKGRWTRLTAEWQKVTDIPAELTNYVVDKCKANQEPPADMQKLIRKYMFK
ncbi:MAG: hypothetical protein K2N13_03385 [Paraprevotella sp.]|nr:hypothetical protein [Paraprevotella sp.]